MFHAARLALFVSFALLTGTSPTVIHENGINVPLMKRANFTSGHAILANDRARATHLRSGGPRSKLQARAGSVPVTNEAVIYTAAVSVGSPPTTCTYLICYQSYCQMLIIMFSQLDCRHRIVQHMGGCNNEVYPYDYLCVHRRNGGQSLFLFAT